MIKGSSAPRAKRRRMCVCSRAEHRSGISSDNSGTINDNITSRQVFYLSIAERARSRQRRANEMCLFSRVNRGRPRRRRQAISGHKLSENHCTALYLEMPFVSIGVRSQFEPLGGRISPLRLALSPPRRFRARFAHCNVNYRFAVYIVRCQSQRAAT